MTEQTAPTPRQAAEDRFFTATTPATATEDQKAQVAALRHQAVELAIAIEAFVPSGRHKSLALTHLEDTLMRANRGIFAPEGHR